jgi:hypothetical protein
VAVNINVSTAIAFDMATLSFREWRARAGLRVKAEFLLMA